MEAEQVTSPGLNFYRDQNKESIMPHRADHQDQRAITVSASGAMAQVGRSEAQKLRSSEIKMAMANDPMQRKRKYDD